MSDGSDSLGPAATAFAEHLRAFHRGLPAGEQLLLEQVLKLAATACRDEGEAEGYIVQIQPSNRFMFGLISEVGLPALDEASKDAAKMTIKFAPEYTRIQSKGGPP